MIYMYCRLMLDFSIWHVILSSVICKLVFQRKGRFSSCKITCICYGENFGKRMIKKVCIIGLDKNNLINGIRVVAIPGKNYVIQQYFSQTVQEGETIAEVLQQCYQELKAISSDFIAFTGNFPSAGCLELLMPKLAPKEMPSALSFELPRYFPCNINNVLWNYRMMGQEEKNNVIRSRVRVFFVQKNEWEQLQSLADESKIKFDAFIYPFMAAGHEYSDLPIYLPNAESDFYLSRMDESGLRHMKAGGDPANAEKLLGKLSDKFTFHNDMPPETKPNLLSCLLLADYILNGDFLKNEKSSRFAAPPRFIPQRLRVLKAAALASGLIALVSVCMVIFSSWNAAYTRYEQIQNETNDLALQLENGKSAERRNAGRDKEVGKALTLIPGKFENVKILSFLVQNIPKNVYISDYILNSGKIFVTMRAPTDPENSLSQLNSSPYFVVSNLRKNRNMDGSYFIYLTLSVND